MNILENEKRNYIFKIFLLFLNLIRYFDVFVDIESYREYIILLKIAHFEKFPSYLGFIDLGEILG